MQEETGDKNALLPEASSGNVAIALVNGNLIKVPMEKYKEEAELPQINITEQLSQTGLWQAIDQHNQHKGGNPSSGGGGAKAADDGSSKKDALNEEERKRLSTMAEEDDEEDCGITIRIDAPTPVPSKHASPQEAKKPFPNGSETSV
ncbi:hypothetical protein MTO96_000112 [Rhipicephalus appendiculatus]